MTAVLLLAVASFAAALALAGSQALASRRRLRASLGRAKSYAAAAPPPIVVVRTTRTPGTLLPFALLALRVRRGLTTEEMHRRLAAAGLARRLAPETYLGVQGVLLAAAAVVSATVLATGGSLAKALAVFLVVALSSLVVPDRLLRRRADARASEVVVALPGALDLLAVSVEAGLGLDAAMARVADSLEGPLADELATTLAEIRVGEARQVALQRLADRIERPEVTSFVRAINRADQLGVSLAETLRHQAAEARTRRQVAAEEQAGKAPVRMLVPTTFLIFPPLFVVVLGPAVMSIAKIL